MIKREGRSLLTRDLSETVRQGGSFWAESPKGQQQFGVFIVTAFIIVRGSRFGSSFTGYVNQIGSKWQNCLLGLCLKPLDCKNLSLAPVDFGLIFLNCCEEVNNTGALRPLNRDHLWPVYVTISLRIQSRAHFFERISSSHPPPSDSKTQAAFKSTPSKNTQYHSAENSTVMF